MGTTIENVTLTRTIVGMTCGKCGMACGLERSFYDKAKFDGRQFCCPRGCHIEFCEFESVRLKRELERSESRRRDAENDSKVWSDKARGQASRAMRFKNDRDRVLDRVQGGTCPHCKRTFQNLARHMKSKHPRPKK